MCLMKESMKGDGSQFYSDVLAMSTRIPPGKKEVELLDEFQKQHGLKHLFSFGDRLP